MESRADPFEDLAQAMLQLERLDETTFRSDHAHDNSQGAVFGGQLLGQALQAARQTAPDWPAHSCSAYFLRPGLFADPIDYAVEVVRDGKAFANRRVLARQGGKVLFDMLCAFHAPGPGIAHSTPMPPGTTPPEDLPDIQDFLRANADRIPLAEVESYFKPLPMQFRIVDAERWFQLSGEIRPQGSFWVRFPSAASISDLADHQPLIAFVADFFIGPVAKAMHAPPFPRRHPVVTISHAMSFHAPARADEWLLYHADSPWSGDGLGVTRGLLFERAGKLIATTMQEVVIMA